MSIDDEGGPSLWPANYERHYWQRRLLDAMQQSNVFREAIESIREIPIMGKHAELIEAADHEPYDFSGEISSLQMEAIWIRSEIDNALRAGVIPHDPTSIDLQYPEAVHAFMRRFGLVYKDKPAKWAIRLIDRIIQGYSAHNHLDQALGTAVQQSITINVSPARAVITVQSAWEQFRKEARTKEIYPEVVDRFAEWEELENIVRTLVDRALVDLRRDYSTSNHERRRNRPRGPSSPRRTTRPKWEQECENLAGQLTGQHFSIHRNDRAAFCKLIGIDAPSGAQKYPKE